MRNHSNTENTALLLPSHVTLEAGPLTREGGAWYHVMMVDYPENKYDVMQ